jgi:hypothetical protein
LLGRYVYNLDDLGCPVVSNIHYAAPGFSCLLPEHSGEFLHCAQNKAFKFGEFLRYRNQFYFHFCPDYFLNDIQRRARVSPKRESSSSSAAQSLATAVTLTADYDA